MIRSWLRVHVVTSGLLIRTLSQFKYLAREHAPLSPLNTRFFFVFFRTKSKFSLVKTPPTKLNQGYRVFGRANVITNYSVYSYSDFQKNCDASKEP